MRCSILACAAFAALAMTAVAAQADQTTETKTAKPGLKVIRGQHTEFMWQGVAAHPAGSGAKGPGSPNTIEAGSSSHDKVGAAAPNQPAPKPPAANLVGGR